MYQSIPLKRDIIVNSIVSIHYFEYMSTFTFPGESHNFWEFLCVDKGCVNVVAGQETLPLNKGEIIFHKPNEFHSVLANGIVAPNLVVVAFECHSPAMKFFENKKLHIRESQSSLLGKIIKESQTVFSSRLDDPYCQKLEKKEQAPFGAEQLIQMYLQQLLIDLIRTNQTEDAKTVLPKSTLQNHEEELFQRIIAYMEKHLDGQLTIADICRDNLVGRSIVQKLFRQKADSGIIDYFCNMKINTAKQLIRNSNMNFTQISESLGYTSIHYFSRQFKKITGMTPSEYASSIKLLSERADK